jgi:hypothetical protein
MYLLRKNRKAQNAGSRTAIIQKIQKKSLEPVENAL